LKFLEAALIPKGYEVIKSENGEEALGKLKEEKIDLVISDVVMPGMNGHELSDRLKSIYPEMKTLYMSGYTDNAIVHHGVLGKGMNFIQKPFSMEGLARKVREVLDSS